MASESIGYDPYLINSIIFIHKIVQLDFFAMHVSSEMLV